MVLHPPGSPVRGHPLEWSASVSVAHQRITAPGPVYDDHADKGVCRAVPTDGLHVVSTAVSTDVDLHGRVVAGDESALGELYTRFGGFVQSLARRVTCDPDAARDVTQEVFVHFWEHPLAFDPDRGALRSWFAMLAHRRAVDWVRREERRRKPPDHLAALVAAPALPGVDEEWEAADEVRRVRETVANLPEKLREAIELAFYRGLTYREVAVKLGIPEGTAKSRMRIALQRIAQNLAEEGMGG